MNRTIDVEFTDEILQPLIRRSFLPGQIWNLAVGYWLFGGLVVLFAFMVGHTRGFVGLCAFAGLPVAIGAWGILAVRRIRKQNEAAIGEFLVRKQKYTFTEEALNVSTASTPPDSPARSWNGITKIELARPLVFLHFDKEAYFLPATALDAELEAFLFSIAELHSAEVIRDGLRIYPPVPARTPSQKLRRAVLFGAAWTLAICLPFAWYLAYIESGKPILQRDSGIASPDDPLAIIFRLQSGRWFHLTVDVIGGPEVTVGVCYDQIPTKNGFEMTRDQSFDSGPTRHYDRKALWPYDKPPIVLIRSAGISEVVLEVREIPAP